MLKKITLLVFAVFTSVISAQTVNIEGNPYGGNPYPTITDAVNASSNGDVILISGVHTESVTIQKSITLRGTDPTTDIIQASASASTTGSGTRVLFLSRLETEALNITIENLGIRHGNADANTNGGGIEADKITGLLTLKNLIIENNHSSRNGGAISIAGSNADIVDCTIRNNDATLDGGAVIIAPNNAAGTDNMVQIRQSLINSNLGRNGGGIYINGNNGFGNNYKMSLIIENSTVSNNAAFSASSGNGGGGIFTASALWTGGGNVSNISLQLNHATFFNNSHAAANKAGIQFAGNGLTNFSAYNSIVVANNDIAIKALNFANTNTTNVVNCILGGLNAAPALVDDLTKNNLKGKTATFAGINGVLSNEGGNTQVLAISEGSTSVDFCSASTGNTMPTNDQRGFLRNGISDAGAYELGGTSPEEDETPAIDPIFCGATINSAFYDYITLADEYDGDMYEFTISNNGTATTIEKLTPSVRFADFGGANFSYGTTYNLSVRVKYGEEYSEASAACEVTLTANPTSAVETFCGQTIPSINTRVYALAVSNATSYKFTIKNLSSNEELEYISNVRHFTFTSLPSFALSTDYEVKIQVKIGTADYGDFGASCIVSTPSSVLTKLRDEFCDVTLSNLNSNIFANVVVGATGYKFKITANGNSQEIERPDTRFSFAFAQGVVLNQIYNVEVAVLFNGQYSAYSDVCTVTTPAALPTTSLRSQFCGATLASLGSNFYARVIVGATAYKFKTMINGNDVVVERNDSRCFMNAFSGATMNQTYSIQVAALINGTWSDYGDACSVTVGTVSSSKLSETSSSIEMSVSPNPSADSFQLSFHQAIANGKITLFDLTGKQIQSIDFNEIQTITFGNELKTGVYIAKIEANQTMKTIKLVKN